MSNSHRLISKFIAQLCEKQYAFANTTLATVVEAKLKEKIKKEAKKLSGEKAPTKSKSKQSKKEEFLARMAKGKKSSKKAPSKNK